MKEQILKLRQEGKTYNQICEELGCAKATVSYHCGSSQKDKTRKRSQKRRERIVILNKVGHFQYDRRVKDKAEDFQRERTYRRREGSALGKRDLTFTWKDVIEKFGWETTCYLTGKKINL